MSIQFLPLGLPVSNSLAISASFTVTSSWAPTTGSIAEYCVNCPAGPTGPTYITVNAIVP